MLFLTNDPRSCVSSSALSFLDLFTKATAFVIPVVGKLWAVMPNDVPRSPMSLGIEWATKASTLGFEFVVPTFLGHFVDRWLGTNPIFLFVGMVLGFIVGMMHILRIAKDSSKTTRD